MIAFFIYITTMTLLIGICYKKEIFWMYCIIRNKKMRHLFPQYHQWKEGDEIMFHYNEHSDKQGRLKAMSEDAIIVSVRGSSTEIYPFQIIQNTTKKKREKKKKYEEFHNDVLPVISSGKSNFNEPKLLN